jgi:hypothetical protein
MAKHIAVVNKNEVPGGNSNNQHSLTMKTDHIP